eukprot:141375-Karenia_brevis.AAC.1
MAGKFQFDTSLLITCTDASWANDTKYESNKVFTRRSQYGRINLLGDPKLWTEDVGHVHFIGWKSALIMRQCRSTFRAETQ